jgi:hypothetical protein
MPYHPHVGASGVHPVRVPLRSMAALRRRSDRVWVSSAVALVPLRGPGAGAGAGAAAVAVAARRARARVRVGRRG